jgi:hypothetical protein
VSIDLFMMMTGAVGVLLTIATAWQGRIRFAATAGLATGAFLVVCMVALHPTAGSPASPGTAGTAGSISAH